MPKNTIYKTKQHKNLRAILKKIQANKTKESITK